MLQMYLQTIFQSTNLNLFLQMTLAMNCLGLLMRLMVALATILYSTNYILLCYTSFYYTLPYSTILQDSILYFNFYTPPHYIFLYYTIISYIFYYTIFSVLVYSAILGAPIHPMSLRPLLCQHPLRAGGAAHGAPGPLRLIVGGTLFP